MGNLTIISDIPTTKKVVKQVLATMELQAAYLRQFYTMAPEYKEFGDDPSERKARKEYEQLNEAMKEIRRIFK